jgi:hypothetical protein
VSTLPEIKRTPSDCAIGVFGSPNEKRCECA